MITDIGIDVDGVLYDFVHAFRNYCSKRLARTDLPYPTTWVFYEEWGITKDTFDEWLEEATADSDLFNSQFPYHNSLEGWAKLRTMDVRLHIMTNRAPFAYKQTVEWLDNFGFTPDSLHFGDEKVVLETYVRDQGAAIDDYPKYYRDYENVDVKAFIRTQEWNKAFAGRHVADLLAFARAIEVHNEYHSMEKLSVRLSPSVVTSNPFKGSVTYSTTYKKDVQDKNPHSEQPRMFGELE